MRWVVVIVVAALCCSPAWSADRYRTFTDSTGREISARILTYDVRKEVIYVQMENGRKGKIELSKLSDDDRDYVQVWQVSRDFLEDRRFKISAKRKSEDNKDKTNKIGIVTRDVENMSYEILLENNSKMNFENINLQYCIYYEQEVSAAGGNKTKQGVYCGRTEVEDLAPGAKQELKTGNVVIYKKELDSGYYYTAGSDSSQDGEIHGIWMQFTMELPGGEEVVREFCLPDSIPNGHTWTTKSIKVGMN
jgi:hypothetical protein